jgi:ABC-type multidrug transport system ATPase subunit/ABC-type multidrug transport system permease subunit
MRAQELADACSATDMARNGVGSSAACLYPRHNEISCRLSQCAGVIEPDDQNFDKNGDPVLDVVYTCKNVQCQSWAGLEPIIQTQVKIINTQHNVQFKFKSFNQTLGTAQAEFVTQAIVLAMECTTGQCVPSNQTAPPAKLPPRGPLSLWAVVAIIIVVVVCLIWFAVAIAVVKQRRPSTVGRAMRSSSRGEGRGRGGATILEEELVSSVSSDSDDGFEGGTLAIASMAFANVKYTVKSAAGHGKQVLKGATGLIKPGELCAIMGPSGAGKSSLLDILAGQAKIGDTEGQAGCVLWNGSVLKASYARRHICRYVMQDDRAMATDTVEEALTFAANMTLPNSVPTGAIPRRVSKVLDQLRLNHVRSSRIGSSDAGGLSGGERRRLAVGVELIARPSVLLLDEPTSGLDSFSADIVIDVLKATAAEGTAVVVTIHQPSSQIFSLFDKLCLLAPGGVQVFFGTPAEALTLARIDRARRSTGSGHTPRPVPQMVATASTAAATSTSTVAGVRRERERELQAASNQTLQAPIGTGSSGGIVSLAVDQRVEVSQKQPDVAKKQGKMPRKPPRKSAGAGAAARPEPEPELSQPKPSQVEAKQSPPVLGHSVEVRSSGGSGEENGDEVAVNLARGVPYLNPAEEVLKYSVDCAGFSTDVFAQAAWRITIDGEVQHVGLTPTTEAVSGSPSPYRRQPMSLVQDGGMDSLGAEDGAISAKMSALGQLPGGFAQLELLCRRGFRNVWRNPNLMFLQLFVTLLVGGATGGLFYHLGMDLKGAENRMGVLFFVVLYFSIISMSSIGTIVSDKEIFLRDRAAGLYTVEPYFASKVICDLLPLRLLPPMLFSLIVYPLCSLHHGRMY